MPEKNTLSRLETMRSLCKAGAHTALGATSAKSNDKGRDWGARRWPQQAAQSTCHVWDDWGFRKPRLQPSQVVFIVVTNLTASVL